MSIKSSILPLNFSLERRDKHSRAFAEFFGMLEMDLIAEMVVKFLQKRNTWGGFTEDEIKTMLTPNDLNLYFHRGFDCLLEYGWIEKESSAFPTSVYLVTTDFILKCKKKADKFALEK